MSLKDALDKLSGVDQSVALPPTPALSPKPPPASPAVAKTAPGAMMKFLSSQSDAERAGQGTGSEAPTIRRRTPGPAA